MKVWAFIDPMTNMLYKALFQGAVPVGINAVEFDVEDINDIILDNGTIRVKTADEKLQEAKQHKLTLLKIYVSNLLAPTDYIITKITEAQILGNTDEVNTLKQTYATQLQQRANIRAWSEQMKQAINNATTLDALNSIEIKYQGGN
ncbi:MAG: hypothetical protein JHC31_06420 [Sulfurihydrogenibium sp.]|jgi:hypothetical protein|nr:hypothetical protein [Sulfurihydrogenibium sp.]